MQYNISDDSQKEFTTNVVNDILFTLDCLIAGRILAGTDNKGRSVMIIPQRGHFLLVRQGKIFGSAKIYPTLQAILDKNDVKVSKLNW